MFADFVKETVSSGGTGNLTVSGAVSGFQTFNNGIGVGVRFPYGIQDGTAWETGVGYLSASTTLVRDTFRASSTGSALNVSTSAEVFLVMNSAVGFESASPASGTLILNALAHEVGQVVGATVDANEIHYLPFVLLFSGSYDSFGFRVTQAGGNARFGLYDVKDGLPDRLIAVHDTSIDISTTTGHYEESFDGGAIWLSAGIYFIGINVDGDPQFEGVPQDSVGCSMLGHITSSYFAYGELRKTRTFGAMPEPADATSLTPISANMPLFGLVAA